MNILTVRLFGAPSVVLDGREIFFPYKKAAALFFYLISKRSASRAELTALLWPDADPPTALKNLRHAIHSIRKAIGADPFLEGSRGAIEFSHNFEIRCDVSDFLSGRLDAYQGDFLGFFSIPRTPPFDEWLSDERNYLQTQYLQQLLSAAQSAFYRNDVQSAENLALRYVDADPFDESAVLLLMQIYCKQKRFHKAIALYHQLCKVLSDEFSISPLRETTEYYYKIIDAWNTSAPAAETQNGMKLFGKDHVLHKIEDLCVDRKGSHTPPCCLVQGAAGVGKSYLMDYVLSQHDFSDQLVLRVSCYESEMRTPLMPWNSIMLPLVSELNSHAISVPEAYLKSASGLFPCLSLEYKNNLPVSDDILPGSNYLKALESALLIFLSIAKKLPLLLIFEDIHWMDSASVEMLSSFLHRLCNLNVTVICTARDTLPRHVYETVSGIERDKLLERCYIYPFTREETEKFICFQSPGGCSDELASRIFENTSGNALLIMQLLAALRDSNDFSLLSADPKSIIALRLKGLSEDERRILDAIAVFPDLAPYDILSSILTIDPLELMYLCSRLCQKVILVESNANRTLGYSFAHKIIRDELTLQQSASGERILHLRVAQCLEAQADKEYANLYTRIIFHYTQGGNPFKAFAYKVRAINVFAGCCFELLPVLLTELELPKLDADGLLAYFESLENELKLLRATHFGSELQDLNELEKDLLYAESRYCIYNGIYERGTALLDRLLSLSRESDDLPMLAKVYLQFIYYAVQTYRTDIFETYVSLGLSLCKKLGQCEELGAFLRLKGLLSLTKGLFAEGRDWLRQSISLFNALDSEQSGRYAISIAGAYNYIAETFRLEQDYQKAYEYYDQAIVYNKSRGYYPGAAVIYTDYGTAAFQNGDLQVAQEMFAYAEELYASFHEYSQRPIALAYLAYFDVQKKAYDDAADRLKLALHICDKIQCPWWKGITIYILWRIRLLLEQAGQHIPALEALWPQDPQAHCQWALENLTCIEPRLETEEIRQALAAMEK